MSRDEKRRRGPWLGLLVAAAGAGVLYYATLSEAEVECEACMRYAGSRFCSRVAAASAPEAGRRAISHACSVLSQGVTKGLECERTPPESLSCQP